MAIEPTTKKPWWQSKIILLALGSILVYGGNAVTGVLTGAGVTPDQIDVIRQTQPDIAESVEQLRNGSNAIQVILGGIIPAVIIVVRKWFTNIPFLS